MKLPNSRCLSAEQSSCRLPSCSSFPGPIIPLGHQLDSIHLLNETREEGMDIRVFECTQYKLVRELQVHFTKRKKAQTNKEIDTW